MRLATLLILPLFMVSCAAFQTGATPEQAAAAEEQILQGSALLAPLIGPFAPFVPLAAGLAVQIGRMIRKKS